MLHLCVISSTLVFERRYGVLATFINVSAPRKLNKTCMKTWKTFLVAQYEKTRVACTHGDENNESTIPFEVQMDDLAADFALAISLGRTLVRHMSTKIVKKHIPGMHVFKKVLKSSLSPHQEPNNCQKLSKT